MGEAHRGVLPHFGKLVAFGNRGQAEVTAFRAWLRESDYKVVLFAHDDESWAMVIEPPVRMRDTRRVLKALWEASPDDPARKNFQLPIADLHVRLAFARQGLPLDRSWFTRGEVRKLGVLLPVPVEAEGLLDSMPPSWTATPWLIQPSVN